MLISCVLQCTDGLRLIKRLENYAYRMSEKTAYRSLEKSAYRSLKKLLTVHLQIHLTACKEAEHQQDAMVCTKTLYRYIDEGLIANLNNMNLWLKLRRKTKTKHSRERKRILGQSIELRPQEVNERKPFGHWEIDTVIGKKTKGEPVLLTLTERLTRYMLVLKIKAKDEVSVKEAIQSMTQSNPYFAKLFKSVTSDNGSEFASLSDALHSISDVYFTHPYSWNVARMRTTMVS